MSNTRARTVTRTGSFIGRYAVYTDGTYEWYYAGRPGSPEWYVYTDPNGDGEYTDADPARYAPYFK
jgi:hypothetical protein